MKFRNLLVISNNFPDKENKYVGNIFVKEQIKYLKNYFENIYVISPAIYGIDYFRKTRHVDYEFDNVKVFFPKYFNFPLFYFYFRNYWIYLEKRVIIKLIRKEKLKFDLIHAHFTWPSGAVAVELKSEFQSPVVITEHTSQTFKNAIEKKDCQFIQTWKQCDAIIRVRKGDISLFNNVGIPLDKIHHIPNGYNNMTFLALDSHVCRNNLGLPLEKKIILNVGNLYDTIKGHKYLIEAMSEVVKHRNDVLCFIVGDGKLRHNLEKQIISAGLQDYVKLVGKKPHNVIPIWMNACDIFIMPSLEESFGIVQIEAMACGKPVVATYNGGSEEIIICDDFGFLCEPGKSKELTKSIIMALNKKWDVDKIRNYANNYTLNKIVKTTVNVYEML